MHVGSALPPMKRALIEGHNNYRRGSLANEMIRIVEVDHKVRGKYLTIGSPIKFSDLQIEVKPSPVLGEHTDEVLADLGYGKEEIAKLHAAKAV